jgi:hypothetical protein
MVEFNGFNNLDSNTVDAQLILVNNLLDVYTSKKRKLNERLGLDGSNDDVTLRAPRLPEPEPRQRRIEDETIEPARDSETVTLYSFFERLIQQDLGNGMPEAAENLRRVRNNVIEEGCSVDSLKYLTREEWIEFGVLKKGHLVRLLMQSLEYK